MIDLNKYLNCPMTFYAHPNTAKVINNIIRIRDNTNKLTFLQWSKQNMINNQEIIEWREGFTGAFASMYQSDHEGYINGEYKYAIQIYKDEITLYTVTYCDYHTCEGIWDYVTNDYCEDGSEIGYCLTMLKECCCVQEAMEIAETIEYLKLYVAKMFDDITHGKIDNNPEVVISGTVKLVPPMDKPAVIDVTTCQNKQCNDNDCVWCNEIEL